jgi:hypothetical protein
MLDPPCEKPSERFLRIGTFSSGLRRGTSCGVWQRPAHCGAQRSCPPILGLSEPEALESIAKRSLEAAEETGPEAQRGQIPNGQAHRMSGTATATMTIDSGSPILQ